MKNSKLENEADRLLDILIEVSETEIVRDDDTNKDIKGYHKLFLPLVKLAENNSIIIFYEDKFVPKDCTKTLIDSLSTKKFHFNFNIIEKSINIPICLWDERLSTVAAFKLSSNLDANITKRVKKIDENAATFILQGAIDYLNN